MKKVFKFTNLLILPLLLTTYSCSDDDPINVITLEDLTVSIDENPTNGQVIGTVVTTQTIGGATLAFSITSQTPTGALNINSSTGELTVADATLFDFETNPTITATVEVDGATNTASVTVNLNNIEAILQDLTVTIDENPTSGQSLGTIQTSGSGAPNFTITSQTPTGALNIDAVTGEITVADASLFDFETNPTITATISDDEATNTATVTINLNNVQELIAQDLTVSIDENPTDGQVLGTMQTNGTGTLSFSVISQTPSGALTINANTGTLSVVDPNLFDYETNPVITANIMVNDGAETATATATINLNDVNEVSAQNINLTIDENPSNGAIVGTLPASGSNLTYTITFQNPAGAFNIDANTGELSVADETLFDFETNPNMLATISVSNGTQSVSANASVVLNNVNELGDIAHGGMIFWLDPADNSHGLVFAFDNQLSGLAWGCSGTSITTGSTIGSGASNTSAIVSSGCATGSAAEVVTNLNYNGFDDWFLPSLDEMLEIATNFSILWPSIQANGGSALSSINWTSTEQDNIRANVVSLGGEHQDFLKVVLGAYYQLELFKIVVLLLELG